MTCWTVFTNLQTHERTQRQSEITAVNSGNLKGALEDKSTLLSKEELILKTSFLGVHINGLKG